MPAADWSLALAWCLLGRCFGPWPHGQPTRRSGLVQWALTAPATWPRSLLCNPVTRCGASQQRSIPTETSETPWTGWRPLMAAVPSVLVSGSPSTDERSVRPPLGTGGRTHSTTTGATRRRQPSARPTTIEAGKAAREAWSRGRARVVSHGPAATGPRGCAGSE